MNPDYAALQAGQVLQPSGARWALQAASAEGWVCAGRGEEQVGETVSNLHICVSIATKAFTRRFPCPTCKRRTSQWVECFEWYGPNVTCLACGEQWRDGEMCPRPFKRGWRAENIAKAKKRRGEMWASDRHTTGKVRR